MSQRLIVDWKGLKRMGWPLSRTHTWRMMDAGEFPERHKLGIHRNSRPVWRVKEILDHFEAYGLRVSEDWQNS